LPFTHVTVPAEGWLGVAQLRANSEIPVAVSFTSGSTAALIAAATADPAVAIVPWLVVGPGYGAALAARDLSTLAHLTEVSDVIVSVELDQGRDHAVLFDALVNRDDVTIANAAGRLEHAYNRPPPPHPIRVWFADGGPTQSLVALTNVADGSLETSRSLGGSR
jgi:hypothetical protein